MKMLSSGHGCHDCGHGNPVLCGWLCAPSDGLSAWIDASAIASQPTVPTSEAVREALERLRQAAEGLRGWERIDGTEAMDEEYHTRVAQLDAEAVATIDRFIRGGDGDAE